MHAISLTKIPVSRLRLLTTRLRAQHLIYEFTLNEDRRAPENEEIKSSIDHSK
jgi:hypothetical protein